MTPADPATTRARNETGGRRHALALGLTLALAALYLLGFVDRGWIPNDEGVLGEMARRVLAGELPHRDFDDPYTGGLSLWNALAFHTLGPSLVSIRWFLFAATLLALTAVYRIAARVSPPALAVTVTALCLVWSVPSYFAGMPSWYNLFLALGAVLALFRHVETGRRRWLAVAGLAAGISFLFKSAALLLVAAVFLFLLWRENELDAAELDATEPTANPRRHGWTVFVVLGLTLFAAILVTFVGQRPGAREILLFAAPGIALAATLAVRVGRRPGGPFRRRLRRLLGLTTPFLLGGALPLALFLVPYAAAGALGSLADPRYLFDSRRFALPTLPPPPLRTFAAALPLALLLALPLFGRGWDRRLRRLWLPLILAATVLALFASRPRLFQLVWYSTRPLALAVVVIGGLTLLAPAAEKLSPRRRQQLFLLLAVTATAGLIQFPLAWGYYFCYVAPLVVLAAVFLVRCQEGAPRRLHLAAIALYLPFGLLWVDFGQPELQGWRFAPRRADVYLEQSHVGLWVPADEAAVYRRLTREVQSRVPPGAAIFATAGCPEVYYLAGRRNPSRTFLDHFDRDYHDPARRDRRRLALLDREAVELVVLCHRPAYGELSRPFAEEVARRYPHHLEIGPYTLHWRTGRAS